MLLALVALVAAAPGTSIKLAAPGLGAVNLSPSLQTFVGDHLNQELVLQGVEVVSESQIAAVLGLERQKQLLGCNETSCLTELANALGVDGLVMGNVAKLGSSFQLDVRVVSASSALNLAVYSTRADDEAGVVDATARAAKSIATQLAQALHRSLVPVAQAVEKPRLETRPTFARTAGGWTIAGSLGAVVLGVVFAVAAPPDSALNTTGGGLVLLGAGGLVVGGLMWLLGGTEQVPVKASLLPLRDGLGVALGWSFERPWALGSIHGSSTGRPERRRRPSNRLDTPALASARAERKLAHRWGEGRPTRTRARPVIGIVSSSTSRPRDVASSARCRIHGL